MVSKTTYVIIALALFISFLYLVYGSYENTTTRVYVVQYGNNSLSTTSNPVELFFDGGSMSMDYRLFIPRTLNNNTVISASYVTFDNTSIPEALHYYITIPMSVSQFHIDGLSFTVHTKMGHLHTFVYYLALVGVGLFVIIEVLIVLAIIFSDMKNEDERNNTKMALLFMTVIVLATVFISGIPSQHNVYVPEYYNVTTTSSIIINDDGSHVAYLYTIDLKNNYYFRIKVPNTTDYTVYTIVAVGWGYGTLHYNSKSNYWYVLYNGEIISYSTCPCTDVGEYIVEYTK